VDKSSSQIILMELFEGKDLERYLSQLRPGFDLGRPTIQKWSLDLLSALEYLHTRDPIIIHCDIKPEPANLLLSPDLKSLKLTDFGISKTLERDRRLASALKTDEGSLHYRAPEVLSVSGTAFFTEK
jgi:eukaryotic-like serine/threonine-protein kinase